MKTRFLIIIPVITILAILAIIAYDSITLDKLCADDGGKRYGDTCRIPIITNSTKDNSQINVSLSQIKTMKPNSMEFFYYPHTKNSEKPDPFQIFMLIRLPEWMGGETEDASAFRAYSTVGVTDRCMVKYHPEQGRQRIENPCHGEIYRSIDGAIILGFDTITANPIALPRLNLSIDENGFLYIEPPKWTQTENGVIGSGKEITLEEIVQDSTFLIKSFAKSYPEYPSIPIEFAGYTLSEISPEGKIVAISYLDFSSKNGRISMSIQKCNCPDPNESLNLLTSNSEFWKIGDTVLKVGGSARDKNNEMPEQYKYYEIQFIKDGYEFRIEGKNLEFMKKEIITNYFPGYKYDDMFLISKTD